MGRAAKQMAGTDPGSKEPAPESKPVTFKNGSIFLEKTLHLPAFTAERQEKQGNNTFIKLLSKHGIKVGPAVAVQEKEWN